MLTDFLAGVRVLDLSQYLPGPGATQILADMGADVLKIEPPGGDPLRRSFDPIEGGALEAAGVSPYYRAINDGKRVLALDLKSADGKATLEKLVVAADALLESYRPGVLDRLGFGRARLQALNPRLVHCALSGYGQEGPLHLAAGHDINYMAFAGGLAATGPATEPAMGFPPVADHASAQAAALGLLGGLLGRARTGRGCFVDMSLAETVLAWQGWTLTAVARGRPPASARNTLNGGAAYYRVYPTRDGRHLTLGAIEPHFWRNFCEAVGQSDWTARQGEPLPQTALIAEVAALFAGRDFADWDRLLSGIDCCYHPVLAYDEVMDRPHVRARGLVRQRSDEGTTWVEAAFPAWVDGRPPPARAPVRDVTAAEALAAWPAPRG